VDPASRSRWVGAIAATAVVAAAIVPFLPALSPEFVNWDDPGALLDNLHYRGLGPRQLVWMFTTFHMGHYMPLTWLSLGWDYVMWEMSAWGYHLDNLGRWLVAHAPFAAGASGGALFDSNHNLVGVLTFFRRGVQKSSYWAMPVDWVIPLTHSDTTTIDHTQLPIWSQQRAGSIRFLQVAGYEIDGDWLPMSESAKRWLAEDPQNSEAARALQFANSKLH